MKHGKKKLLPQFATMSFGFSIVEYFTRYWGFITQQKNKNKTEMDLEFDCLQIAVDSCCEKFDSLLQF